MKNELERLIYGLNPWLSDPSCWPSEVKKHLPDSYVKRLFEGGVSDRWQEASKAHLVLGPRQVGKSTSIWKYLQEKGGRVLFLNCEEELIREWCQSPVFFLQDLKGFQSEVDIIFFEEIQHLKEAGLFLKGLIDQRIGLPVLVTGSSSYHLHAQTRESLAGRATRTRVFPFSLKELNPRLGEEATSPWTHRSREIIAHQLRYGMYPEVWFSQKKEQVLLELVESFIIRDASDLFRVRHVAAFRQLMKLAAGQIGNLVNYGEWAGIVGVDAGTVKNYVHMLSEGGVIAVVEPFAGGKRSEITSAPVIYFYDLGIRNSLTGQLHAFEDRPDRGPLLENWVFSELVKLLHQDVTIRYWRTKSGAEVDLVLSRGSLLIGVEVKCAKLSQPKISRGARSFIEAYQPSHFFVVNQGYEGKSQIDSTTVFHCRPEFIETIVTYCY